MGTGLISEPGRPIRSNFRERGFTTYLEAGVPNDLLEKAFAGVERRVLNEIRTVNTERSAPEQRADVANLFAVHLVRSPSFREFCMHIGGRFREVDTKAFVRDNPELVDRFVAQNGRTPREGELLEMAQSAVDGILSPYSHIAETMARQHEMIAEKLNSFHLQIIEVADGALPGFVLGDTPVVHAALNDGRYGFRDRLAVLDASVIVGPLTRTVAACFSSKRTAHVRVTTRRRLDAINAIFLRAAEQEVACHPDDAKATQQTFSRLDRLPPSLLA